MKELWVECLGYLIADYPNAFRAKFTDLCIGLSNWGGMAACPCVAVWGGEDGCPCLLVPCLGLIPLGGSWEQRLGKLGRC